MPENFRVTGVTDSNVEGVRYRSIYTEPLIWENRPEPFLATGPLNIQMDCAEEVIAFFRDEKNNPVPGVYELTTGTRRAAGGKSKTFVYSVSKVNANQQPVNNQPAVNSANKALA